MCVRLYVFVSPKAIYFVVENRYASLESVQISWCSYHDGGTFFVPGVCCQPPTGLALSFNATLTESPGKMKCFCGVGIVILAKFCLLIDLGPKTPDHWGCRNPSAWVLLVLQLYDWIADLCAAESDLENFSAAENGLCAIWQPLLPF